jgi:two-component system NtrC family response regulator
MRDLPKALAQLEEVMIRAAIAETGGNRTEAARRLGIRRQLLYAKLRQYGIEP